jgi:hypothetical protein
VGGDRSLPDPEAIADLPRGQPQRCDRQDLQLPLGEDWLRLISLDHLRRFGGQQPNGNPGQNHLACGGSPHRIEELIGPGVLIHEPVRPGKQRSGNDGVVHVRGTRQDGQAREVVPQ